jgi:hypothetical protein
MDDQQRVEVAELSVPTFKAPCLKVKLGSLELQRSGS